MTEPSTTPSLRDRNVDADAGTAAVDTNVDLVGDGSRDARRWKAYRLALEGVPAAKIGRALGVSRQAASLLLKRLVARGILEADGPRSNIRTYRRGPNAASFEGTSIPYWAPDADAVNVGPIPIRPNVRARVHAAAVRFDLRSVDWGRLGAWKTWTSGAGTRMAATTFVLDGRTYGLEIRGRALVIRLPDAILASADDLMAYRRTGMAEDALRAVRAAVARWGLSVDPTPHLHQKLHIAFPDTAGVFALAKDVLLHLDGEHGYWTDFSTGPPELETSDLGVALLFFALPALLRSGRLRWAPDVKGALNPHSSSG